jgi:hypothetical protein
MRYYFEVGLNLCASLKAGDLSGLKLIKTNGLYNSEQENVHYCEGIINPTLSSYVF